MSYSALILLPERCKVSLDEAAAKLAARLPKMRQVVQGSVLTLTDGWTVRIILEVGAHVGADAKDVVAKFGKARKDADQLASAPRRFEVSTAPDPSMNHFNDYLFILEVLTTFEGAAAFEMATEEFL